MIRVTLSGQTWQRSDVEQSQSCSGIDCLSGTRLSNEQMGPREFQRRPETVDWRIGTALGKEMGGRKQMSGVLTAHWARTGYVALRPLGVETFIPNKQ
jgi:hypothetical protein